MVGEKEPLPHHVQQPLCTTRRPYRQGRKFTAVKIYTINNESNHLLIFGVPSINLRRETKTLFQKHGKLISFSLTKDYRAEEFTETYHAIYENIKSARSAKIKLDTKNFYGGILHLSYAPEYETIEETRNKLFMRRKDVLKRLERLKNEKYNDKAVPNEEVSKEVGFKDNSSTNEMKLINNEIKLDMGSENVIYLNNRKRKKDNINNGKKIKSYLPSCLLENNKELKMNTNVKNNDINDIKNNPNESTHNHNESTHNYNVSLSSTDIIDFTSTDKETITNIDEALNYNKFGNEVIKKVETKPLNKIKFNFLNK